MDHSHMDHGGMGHGDMGHGDHGMPGMEMCSMNMLFNWDTTNLCIVFEKWHIRGPVSLVFSLLAVVVICAGYEALRSVTRQYDAMVAKQEEEAPRQNAGKVGQRARLTKSVLYAIQNFYAFMIMLIFMTYNGWVMIAVTVGAGVGYWIFGSQTKVTKETACH